LNERENTPGRAGAARSYMTDQVFAPFHEFLRTETGGGFLLLAAAFIALVWANSQWDQSYFDLWHTAVSIDIPFFRSSRDLQHWVNDGLMVGFFLVVGLEIKRETLYGELASPRRALLPAAAALGGMIVPALLFASINIGGAGAKGWGIPMATDIAFALAVLALLGNRISSNLRLFLLALAIVDDLGAISVIAIFYTKSVEIDSLAAAAAILAVILVVQTAGVRNLAVYLGLGLLLWMAVLQSGIHATVAGVLLAVLVPGRLRAYESESIGPDVGSIPADALTADGGDAGVEGPGQTVAVPRTPLERLEHFVHPWSSFVFVPVFAFANSGISLSSETVQEAASSSVTLGVIVGLLVGKLVGVAGAVFLVTRIGGALLPSGVTWPQILGASLLAGIGFTVSLFITDLAFESPALTIDAKIGILTASVIAAAAGYVVLRIAGSNGNVAKETSDHRRRRDLGAV
jgi:NhaA family Na+:H+ antiporter